MEWFFIDIRLLKHGAIRSVIMKVEFEENNLQFSRVEEASDYALKSEI